MKVNGYTESFLTWYGATNILSRTGKALDLDQHKHFFDGTDSHLQAIYPEYLKKR